MRVRVHITHRLALAYVMLGGMAIGAAGSYLTIAQPHNAWALVVALAALYAAWWHTLRGDQ